MAKAKKSAGLPLLPEVHPLIKAILLIAIANIEIAAAQD